MLVDDVKSVLDEKEDLREGIYARGFLFTTIDIDQDAFPFYGKWSGIQFADGKLYVHPKQKYTVYAENGCEQVLIGHAYDPVSMRSDETEILSALQGKNDRDFYTAFNQLTGVFTYIRVGNGTITLLGDPTCMQTAFYYADGQNVLISSHTNLIGQIKKLQWDPYIKHLTSYKFFKLLGNSLPGDLTQYAEVKRVVPNFEYTIKNHNISYRRFFTPHKQQMTEEQIVDAVAELMHNNMSLIAEKWKNPAISMTGGCDSKTTLACTNGLYDKFSYFSYESSEAEQVDAEAAGKICATLGLAHKVFAIPQNDSEVKDPTETAMLLRWNCGDIRNSNANDVRKRAYFRDAFCYDVEVKSWASEIGRAYYSKRFNGRTNFGSKPTPRKMTTLYKFFFHDRKLVRETDKVFKKYAADFFQSDAHDPVEWQDQFFWEFRVPSWNGLVITGEHRYSFDVTIPYNNRLLLNLLLSAPIEDRITDKVYKDIRLKMNPGIDATGIAVQNLKHTKNREKAENIYYVVNTSLPF